MGTIQNGVVREYVDDRTLAHLHIVIARRFRDGENFSMVLPAVGDAAPIRMWMDRDIPLSLTYVGLDTLGINSLWLSVLVQHSHRSGGLVVSAEPL